MVHGGVLCFQLEGLGITGSDHGNVRDAITIFNEI